MTAARNEIDRLRRLPLNCKPYIKCADMKTAVAVMWGSEPTWGPEAFARIQCPVWVVDGDHE